MTSRPETGPMRFGDDEPGVFLRGDWAKECEAALERVLGAIEYGHYPNRDNIDMLRGLAWAISGCDHLAAQPVPVQVMRSFEECEEK